MVKVVAHNQWFKDMFSSFSIESYIKLYTLKIQVTLIIKYKNFLNCEGSVNTYRSLLFHISVSLSVEWVFVKTEWVDTWNYLEYVVKQS